MNAIPVITAASSIVVGLVTLAGWWLDVPVLKSLLPGMVSMKPNTALAFVLGGLSLLLQLSPDTRPALRRAGQGIALAVLAVGGLTLCEYLFSRQLGIDELFFKDDPAPSWTPYPGRMAALTAAAFVLLGLALARLDWQPRRLIRPAEIFALLIVIFCVVDLLEYFFGLSAFYHGYPHTRMALHTTATFTALSAGLVTARPALGLLGALRSGAAPANGLGRHVFLALGCGLAVLLITALVSLFAVRDLVERTGKVTQIHELRRSILQVLSSLQDLEIGNRGYALTGNVEFLQPYEYAIDSVARNSRDLAAALRDAGKDKQVLPLEALVQQRVQYARMAAEVSRTLGIEAARQVIVSGEGKRMMDAIGVALAGIDGEAITELGVHKSEAQRSAFRLYWVLLASVSLTMVIVLYFGRMIFGEIRQRRHMEGEIKDANQRLERLVSERTVALRASEQQANAIISSAHDGIILADEEHRIILFNPAAEKILGHQARDVMGKPVDLLIPERFRGAHGSQMQLFALSGGESRRKGGIGKIAGLRADGNEVPLEASIGLVAVDGHRFFYVAFRDVTEQLRIEQERAALNAELQQRVSDLQRYAHIVTAASDMLAFRDMDDRFVVVNDAYCRYFGRRSEEIIGRTPKELFGQGDYNDLIEPASKRGLRGERVITEGWITYPAMGRRYMELQYNPFVSATGQVLGMVVGARDITERHQSEEQLRFSDRHFQELLNSSPSMIYELYGKDPARPVFLSAGLAQITGYTPEEIIVEKDFWRSRIHPEDLARVKSASRRGRETGECTTEYRFQHRDGNYRWIRDSFRVVDLVPSERRIIGSCTDITSYMQTAMNLQDSELRFKTVAELGSDLIFEATYATGAVTWFGDVDVLLGLQPGAGPRTLPAWFDAIDAEDRERVRKAVQVQRENPNSDFSEEYRVPGGNGRPRWWQVKSRIVANRKGEGQNWVGSVRDVTREKNMELQLAQSQKMEAVGQLTGGVAHDFNNRLTAILGSLELLQRQLKGNPDAQRLIATALRAVEGGASLTKQLLTFSRRQVLESQMLNVTESINGILPLIIQTLGEDIEVQFQQHDPPWAIKTDPALLENALLNLVLNSRDAMPNGGRLIIETQNVVLGDVYLQTHVYAARGEHVLISVSDTGSGITKDLLQRVLEPFFTTKDQGKGTGLGLSMVYGFIRQSGGHIEIYSEERHGTSVKLYFPRYTGNGHVVEAVDEAGVAADDGGWQILVVEDDESVRQLAAVQLAELGYQVSGAESGPAALEQADRLLHLDLLFTDVIMPGGLTGMDLAARLRERWPDLNVIFTSGYTRKKVQSQWVEHGPRDHWLPKPYSFATLVSMISAILKGNGGSRTHWH